MNPIISKKSLFFSILILMIFCLNNLILAQTFTVPTRPGTSHGARLVYDLDINSDKNIDILSTSLNDSVFITHIITNSANGAWSVHSADVDNDGDMDVLSALHDDHQIIWYENDGYENFSTHIIFENAYNATYVNAIDMDGDGDVDILSAADQSVYTATIAWHENIGNEEFILHPVSQEFFPYSVFPGDLDSDGDLDIIASFEAVNPPIVDSPRIVWYENNGHMDFTYHLVTDSVEIGKLSLADIDNDGNMDILFASNQIIWLKNDGNSNFSAYTLTTLAQYAWSVYVADVDGDGDMDVLSASYWDNKIAWYENNGNSNFSAHTITTLAQYAWSVYAADVDGDGDMDVLSASSGDDKIAWYENDGNQNFTLYAITTAADGAKSVYAADVDGDGDMDVLSASSADDKIAWYENQMVTEINQNKNLEIPVNFKLYSNYPNPFNPSTNIEFDVKKTCSVTLKIYDIQGRLISILIDQNMSTGHYKINFNADNLTSGIYFYTIKMGEYMETRKMILNR